MGRSALTAIPIANLISGVSQQPPTLRIPTAFDEQENAWSSVVTGLNKRPPTEHIAEIPVTVTDNVATHLIDREGDYRYSIILNGDDLQVFDLEGVAQTVVFPDGKSYITESNPISAFRMLTIGDTTFILNKNKVTSTSAVSEPVQRLNPSGMATLYVTQSNANTYYSVYVNSDLKASFLTGNGINVGVQGTDTIAEQIELDLALAGYSVTRNGSTITLTGLPAGTKIKTTAGNGDKSFKTYADTIDNFLNLPPNELQGRIVKVQGSVLDNGDDYYVIYNEGVWEETWAYGSQVIPNPLTMPHVLVRETSGDWTFKKHTWVARQAGSSDSNKNPSFIGTTINDMLLYVNRLAFLADENIIFSEANSFENFYRTTLATLVDSDPIDFAVLNNGVDILRHAVPYDRDLLLMSERNQYRLTYQSFLGPKNVQIAFSTAFNVSPTVKPINMGNSVYFIDDKEEYTYSKVFDFYPQADSVGDDADETTAPITQYILSGTEFLAGSPRVNCMVLNSTQAPNVLYIYKFFWSGETKVQNCWGKWIFEDCEKILWSGFSKNYLYIILKRSDGVFLERIRMDEQVFSRYYGTRILLDRFVSKDDLILSYDSVEDETTITTPWSTVSDIEVVSTLIDADPDLALFDFRHDVNKISSNQVKVNGDITGHTYINVGIPYNFMARFSKPYMRQQKGNGEVVVLDMFRLQMRYMSLEYHDTAYFKTTIKYPGRDDVYGTFDGKIIGDANNVLGATAFISGIFRIPLLGNNNDMTLEISNDSPYPCSFGSAEWFFIAQPKAGLRV